MGLTDCQKEMIRAVAENDIRWQILGLCFRRKRSGEPSAEPRTRGKS